MRRFELIKGNKARFWEIDHYDEVVWTRTGTIGKKAKEREKLLKDDMAAEVEFDKQIHAKRRKGWVEVDEPSDPLPPFEERALEMRPLDGSEPERFSGEAMAYLLWRMVEVQLFDRHREAPDLSRWDYRAWRSLGLDSQPEEGDPGFEDWVQRRREVSIRDRAPSMEGHEVGAFKFTEGRYWIVTPEECEFIAREAPNRPLKRRKDKEKHKKWVAKWAAFHERAREAGGYEVVPV